MSLEQRINDDYVQAMKSGDRARKDVLRLLRSALKNAAIEARPTRDTLDDEAVIRVLQHEADHLDGVIYLDRVRDRASIRYTVDF